MIDASAYIHPDTIIGKNVKIGPNCSIGYDGLESIRGVDNIPRCVKHSGIVIIENDVEILANVTIARGISVGLPTLIGEHAKIGNLVNIGHSCKIGENNIFISCTCLGGSVVVGRNNFFGLGCVVMSSITIGEYNLIGMGAVVLGNIPDHEVWVGNPARKLKDNLMFNL